MKFRTIKELGWYAAAGLVEIPREAVQVEQAGGDAGHALVFGIDGLADCGIDPEAVTSVVVKDNFLHDRTVLDTGRPWAEVLAAGPKLEVPLPRPLVPTKTEISLVFTRPGDSKIVASTRALRLPDEQALQWLGTKSFFRTRPEPGLKRPVTAVMDPEGPLFLFGSTGPRCGDEAKDDPRFVAGDVMYGVEKFVTHLLYSDHEEYQGKYWEAFMLRVAGLLGHRSFADLKAAADGRVEETALEVCEAFYRDRAFKDVVKKLQAQRRGETETGEWA